MGHQRIVAGLRANGEEFPSTPDLADHRAQQAFHTVILRDVTERMRANASRTDSREEIKELAPAANSVREQEKSCIARELHDELGRAPTALKIDVVWMKQNLRRRPRSRMS